MSIPGSAEPLLLAQQDTGGYQIQRSLRFNSSDSAFLSRTPASAGNRKTWTWAGWVKRTALTATNALFAANSGTNPWGVIWFRHYDGGTGNIDVDFEAGVSSTSGVRTTATFRDPSAWYHIVVAVDTTQATPSNRVKIYVNGIQQQISTSWWPSQNFDTQINSTSTHYIGQDYGHGGSSNDWFNGYLADIHFIDGQALTPSSFTEVSATTGQLIPKAYTGTFTGNSFWLKFADNSAATATTLGKDSSGLGNNWTPNNLSVLTSTTVYTNSFSISGTLFPGSSLANAFDGNIATSATVTNAAQNQTLTFAPSPGIAYTSGVEVYLTPTGDVSVTRYSFNGGSDQSFAAGDGWKTVASGSGTLTSLVIKQGAQSNSVGISAIRINGTTILVDNAARNNDSLVDTPTSYGTDTGAGGEVRGNYATLNPLAGKLTVTLSDGNLTRSGTVANNRMGTIGMSSGKWYWEVLIQDVTALNFMGVTTYENEPDGYAENYVYSSAGGKWVGTVYSAYGSSYGVGDIIGVAYDADSGSLTCYKNGVSQGQLTTGITKRAFPLSRTDGTGQHTFNFGQRPFAYTAPSGFKALCDTNLPAPVVAKPSTVMDVKLYTGNGSTQTISGLNFSPDLVWGKARTINYFNTLQDTVRGAGKTILYSNTTDAENAYNQDWISSFTSDGFSLASGFYNESPQSYVAWCWDAGSSTVSNTQGSITSQVRANASAGFSIVSYTGTGANATVGHGLGVQPGLVIVKKRDVGNSSWAVWHSSLLGTQVLLLQETLAVQTVTLYWNSLTPTSSVINLGSSTTNDSGNTYVAYCFAPVAGYSSFGSYTGNGSTDGTFVYTGFRPRWILYKPSNRAATDWVLWDTARNPYNIASNYLLANTSGAEGSVGVVDILSNGFKLRVTSTGNNGAGDEIVYAAFAESPFAYARAR